MTRLDELFDDEVGRKRGRPSYPSVELSAWQIKECEKVATLRVKDAASFAKKHLTASRDEQWEYDRRGCIAEFAFSHWSGLPWTGRLFTLSQWTMPSTRPRDVGNLFEVRSRIDKKQKLVLREKDVEDEVPYVLVCLAELPVVSMIGWIFGTEARKQPYQVIYGDAGAQTVHILPLRKLRGWDEEPVASKISPRGQMSLLS